MQEAVIVSACRTPIGRFQGGLSGVRPDDLAAISLGDAARRVGLDPVDIDEVVLGCANQAGEDNRNVARMAALLAGFGNQVSAVTVNRLCASGMEAVVQAARQIRCGDARVVVAGGVESMSRAPYSMARGPNLPKAGNVTIYDTSLGWRYPNPKLEALFPLEAMGETAENVAEQHAITREDQDAFALASHQKAVAAIEGGAFAAEIVGVPTSDGVVSRDEGPRADSTLAALAKLKAAFRKGGTVTAGNSSTLNDGSAALVLMSAEEASRRGLKARARIRATGAAGVDPRVMGIGPIPATQKALARAGLTVAEIDLWELNEAFAAQSLAVIRALGIAPDRVNVNGGAIALGHPLGMSGARILITLLHAMEARDARFGAATLCVGVGQGATVILDRG